MTLGELFILLENQRERRFEEQRWQAAVAGHDIGGRSWKFNEKNTDILDDDSGLFGINIE